MDLGSWPMFLVLELLKHRVVEVFSPIMAKSSTCGGPESHGARVTRGVPISIHHAEASPESEDMKAERKGVEANRDRGIVG